VYDFILVINSNLSPISHRYWDRPTATYWTKITNFAHPRSHLAPSFGVTLFEFMEKLYGSWNRVFQAPDGENLVILACIIFDWSTRVTDGQTDGQNCNGWDALKAVAVFARKNQGIAVTILSNVLAARDRLFWAARTKKTSVSNKNCEKGAQICAK